MSFKNEIEYDSNKDTVVEKYIDGLVEIKHLKDEIEQLKLSLLSAQRQIQENEFKVEFEQRRAYRMKHATLRIYDLHDWSRDEKKVIMRAAVERVGIKHDVVEIENDDYTFEKVAGMYFDSIVENDNLKSKIAKMEDYIKRLEMALMEEK
jgi:hypothetical protein